MKSLSESLGNKLNEASMQYNEKYIANLFDSLSDYKLNRMQKDLGKLDIMFRDEIEKVKNLPWSKLDNGGRETAFMLVGLSVFY